MVSSMNSTHPSKSSRDIMNISRVFNWLISLPPHGGNQRAPCQTTFLELLRYTLQDLTREHAPPFHRPAPRFLIDRHITTGSEHAVVLPASGAFPRDTVLSPRPTSRMRSPAWPRRRPSRSLCSSSLFPPGRTLAPSRCGSAGL